MNSLRELSRREVSSQAQRTTLPATMSSATPLGTLSTIPRELRNEIYQYLFPEQLVVHSRYKAQANSHVTHSLHLAIFRTSKSVSEEATTVFYSETTFHYEFNCQTWGHERVASATLRRRMSNVEATIQCDYPYIIECLGWFFCGLRSASEGSPLKNTLRIVFTSAHRGMPEIDSTGFFQHLEYLRSFRNIVIEVTRTISYSDMSGGIFHEISNVDKERLAMDLGVVLDKIEGKVAKVLKAGKKSEIGPRTGLNSARRTVFHPCELPAKHDNLQNMLLQAGEVEV